MALSKGLKEQLSHENKYSELNGLDELNFNHSESLSSMGQRSVYWPEIQRDIIPRYGNTLSVEH